MIKLIVYQDIKSNIQIVANYLELLKNNKVDDIDLYFEGITPEEFLDNITTKKAEILSQEKCQTLIFDEIKKTIPEPNYYQIKSFIDVLATQFISFNRNYYLNANLLKEYRINEGIRTFIIESYIKLTKHFTKGAFTELVANQKATENYIKLDKYDSDKINNTGITELSNIHANLISFDKFNYPLIFFHEGDGQGFSIISNLSNINTKNNFQKDENIDDDTIYLSQVEHKKLYKLYNFQIYKGENNKGEEDKDLPDYKNYKQKDFLVELKNILDLKNPLTKIKDIMNLKKIEAEEMIKIEQQNLESSKITQEEKEQSLEKIKKFKEQLDEFKTKISLEEIVGKYVFTADNFIKMILILLRIRSNIPVIMMGETGCGKTSLIKMLSKLINSGSELNMKILSIDAGTTDKDIINFITNKVLPDAIQLEKDNKKNEEEALKNNKIFNPKKIWVFLDEINTCKSMGLISELMCKHSYQSTPLPNNIIFIAACNPYRIYEKGKKINIGLDINQAYKEKKYLAQKEIERLKKNNNNNLVYTVNPLPHSLLNYVFDFGNLEPKDEKKYIQSIIEEPIKNTFNICENNNTNIKKDDKDKNKDKEDEINELDKLHKFATLLISKAQNFTRKYNEISSVSLREIKRFNVFYEFFFDYLKNKKEFGNNPDENMLYTKVDTYYNKCDYLTLQKYSIILGIFMCYYLRIINNEMRKEFKYMMNKELKRLNYNQDFLEIPKREEIYVINNIELEKGIAQNRALLDNVFSLFVAINNKIPIFIVGKPGCSKSLSVQLINKSMKGDSSSSILFKKYPKIIINSFQGSMASTSQGVKRIFTKARDAIRTLKEKDKKENISMIYFDEMGLAEHSPNNPLKVIHAELDEALDDSEDKIAFVGISNWTLDASKMNRGMQLSIPESSEEDTKNTAFTIGKSYDENLANQFKSFYEKLGLTYYKYKEELKKNHKLDRKEDFHGNRDFYHLIKYSAREITKKYKINKNKNDTNKIQDETAFLSLERNFGGLKFTSQGINKVTTSIKIIKEIYSKKEEQNNYEVLERIKDNIDDIKSRYLLIISKSSASIFLLSTILYEKNKEYNLYVGSQFYRDHHSEEYSLKILNKIQLHMEQGKILILKNLESVYPALYDLFNQNFTEFSKKMYARIAIGTSTNKFALVNDDFRCIVSVNTEQIDHEEAPFLNRFEKHIVSMEYLLKPEIKKESEIIFDKLKEMINIDKNEYKGIK